MLGNSWVDDSEKRDWMGLVLLVLSLHFDLVVQSCRAGARLPDPALLRHALQELHATPEQASLLYFADTSMQSDLQLISPVVPNPGPGHPLCMLVLGNPCICWSWGPPCVRWSWGPPCARWSCPPPPLYAGPGAPLYMLVLGPPWVGNHWIRPLKQCGVKGLQVSVKLLSR